MQVPQEAQVDPVVESQVRKNGPADIHSSNTCKDAVIKFEHALNIQ